MGREIRRVPPDWEHPKDAKGHYKPLFDQTYQEAMQDFEKHPEDWGDSKPNPDYYLPPFNSEPTHYQIYETVSEGTPTSPVFASLDEMKGWLLNEGYSEVAASKFVETGWAPSFFMEVTDRGSRVSKVGIGALDFEFSER